MKALMKKKKAKLSPAGMNAVLGVTAKKPEPDMPMRTRSATKAASSNARMKRLSGVRI